MAATVISPDQHGWRVDRVVAAVPSVGSRRRARQAIETGKVRLDGRILGLDDVSRPVEAGARLEVDWDRPGTSRRLVAAKKALVAAGVDVLWSDEAIVAVDKPAGLLTDSATREQYQREDSLRKRLAALLRAEGDAVRIVHRIDRDTTGVVLAARTEAAEAALLAQFHRQEPVRVYRALVHGEPRPGTWEDWMAWDRARRLQVPTRPEAPRAVLARAEVALVERFGDVAEIEVRLVTGRRNQIRLQAMLRGCPLVGERLYVPEEWDPRGRIRFHRQALHAWRLGVRHPTTGAPIAFEAPFPTDIEELRGALRARRR